MTSSRARARRPLSAALTCVLGILLMLPGVAVASISHPRVVNDNPANFTPNVEGSGAAVHALHQVSSTMYAGGTFATVSNAARTTTYQRTNLMSFDATTGALTSFSPNINGAVWAIASSGSSLYVGGYFTTVNGVQRRGLVKLDATTGAVDPAFNANFGSGHVTELHLVNGRLIAGGSFPQRLVALDPGTGADTGYINVAISGTVADNAGPTDIYRFAVDPAGTRLVAIGNFTTVAGQARSRAFMLTMGTTAELNDWYYQPLTKMCMGASVPAYLRDVDFSPDGSYFVVVATGYIPAAPSGIGTDVCDAAARFETDNASPTKPTWINYTGGDTLLSVAVTGAAVYVQGHQRWVNNPQGAGSTPGPGAVPREGIAALNPTTGLALPWNPGKSRAIGGYELYATSAGLWVGSDGTRFNGEYRRGIAFCSVAAPAAPAVPGAFKVIERPQLKGKARVGRRLKVDLGAVSPSATGFKIVWKRGQSTIKHAKRRSYKLRPADRGTRITVRVTYQRPGVATLKLKPSRSATVRA